MYPRVDHQLMSLKRVLKDVIRPDLATAYAENVLYFCVRTLNQLGIEANAAHPANIREADILLNFLAEIAGLETPPDCEDLIAATRRARDLGPPDPADVAETDARVAMLRSVAADIMRQLAFRPGAEAVTAAADRYVTGLARLQADLFLAADTRA